MSPDDKLVVIVNGRGQVGKDTLCDYYGHLYPSRKYSAIEPIKKIARSCGWNGQKDEEGRKFLSDLKNLVTKYSDLPYKKIVLAYKRFLESDKKVWFLMIREPDEIERVKRYILDTGGHCATLLIRRADNERLWGNMADDGVYEYAYDYIFDNYAPLEAAQYDFICCMKAIIDDHLA